MFWIILFTLSHFFNPLSSQNKTDEPLSHEHLNFTLPSTVIDNETINETTYDSAIDLTSPIPSVTAPTRSTFHDFHLSSEKLSDKFFTTCEECFCDVTPDLCDMNCCCDQTCTTRDMQVFSACSDLISPISRKFCFKRNIFRYVNTKYEILKTPDELYCAIPVSPKQRTCFTEHEPVYSREEQTFLSKHRCFTLSSAVIDYCGFTNMKVGDPIFIHVQGEYRMLGLPHPLFGSCDRMEMVHYMINKKVTCHTVVNSQDSCKSMEILNGNIFHHGIQVIGNIPIQPFICDQSVKCDPVDSVEFPSFNNTTNECRNVLTGLQYTIIHDGIHGIKQVKLNVVLTNISIKEDRHTILPQTFSVYYKRDNISEAESSTEISQPQGYQQGHQIFIGSCTNYGTPINSELLTIIADKSSGCSQTEPVHFGMNVVSSCLLKETVQTNEADAKCNQIKTKIENFLNVNSSILYYIGKFRNANPKIINEWAPLFNEFQNGSNEFYEKTLLIDGVYCKNLTVSVHLTILFALTGHKSNPEAKILGATKKFTRGGYVFSSSELLSVHISAAVSFIDVTDTL